MTSHLSAALVVLTAGALVIGVASACSSSTDRSATSSSSSGSSGTSGDVTCPNDVPSSCPSPEPSYANDVAPVLTRACKGCHTPGGPNPSQLFDTYAQVHTQRTSILTQVSACRMPPADAGTLTSADRQVLLGWLVCDAPDN